MELNSWAIIKRDGKVVLIDKHNAVVFEAGTRAPVAAKHRELAAAQAAARVAARAAPPPPVEA